MLIRILKLPPERRLAYDLSSLRSLIHAAAPCPPEAKEQFIEWLGPIVDEYYSGTEKEAGLRSSPQQSGLIIGGRSGGRSSASGLQPAAEMQDELKAFIRSHLAGYKVPCRIDFRDDLPRLETGKLAKHILRKEYLAARTA